MPTAWRWGALLALVALAGCGSDETSTTSAGPSSAGTGAGGAGASGGGAASGGAGGAGGAVGVSCEPGTRTGDPAGAENEMTANGTDFNVRVPPAYDPTIGSPLIVVYAPAGADAPLTESFTKLTPDATARGYLIAYADHLVPQTAAQVADAASIADLIAAKWCVDPARIYLTGHSDGGSVATVVALSEAVPVAAIAPSAAGTNGAYLAQQPCPAALPVMVMHSKNDQLFTGFGAEAAKYWAGCDACAPDPGAPLPDGCVAYTGCTADVEVQYCEGSAQHGVWPGLNSSILDFFDRFTHPG